MKLILFVFLFALVATSFAITLKAKAKAVLKALSENAAGGDSYKLTFKNLLQITDEDDYSQVADVLNAVRDEISALLAEKQQTLQNEDEEYNAQLKVYEGSINDLQSQLDAVEAELSSNIARRDAVQQIIQDSGAAISQAVSDRDNEVARRQAASQSFESQRDAIAEAIAQCDQATVLLRQVASEDLPGASANFLEIRRKKLHQSLLQIEKKIKDIKLNSPVVPFIKTLISIAQQTINQDVLEQIISLINDLRNSLQAELDGVNQDDATDEQRSQSTIENLSSTISSQQKHLSDNQDALVQVTASIDTLSNQQDSIQDTLDRFTGLLNSLDDSHAARASALSGLTDRLQRDIAAIDQALNFLQSQQS